jgi:hypothetical protein
MTLFGLFGSLLIVVLAVLVAWASVTVIVVGRRWLDAHPKPQAKSVAAESAPLSE